MVDCITLIAIITSIIDLWLFIYCIYPVILFNLIHYSLLSATLVTLSCEFWLY